MSGFEAFNVSSLKTVAKPVDDTQNGDKLEHIEVPARIPAAPAVEAAPAPAPAVQQAEARGTPPQHQAIPSLVLAHAPDGQLLAQRQPGYVTESPQNNHDPKKRKRNFSNRTKTGCLTCRKRKKKCDEAKPECNNCIKGALVCAGYHPRRGASWPKIIENKTGEAPPGSKEPNYVSPGAFGMPASHYTITEHKSRTKSYTLGANTHPTAVSASGQPPVFGDHATNNHQQHYDAHAPPVLSARMASQMALSHAQAQPHNMAVVPYDRNRSTQKEEFLRGCYFDPYAAELSMERDRAAKRCWRFNSFTYPPINGVSTDERAHLFLDIVQPRGLLLSPVAKASARNCAGRVGHQVIVESPFHCDYGYNISIGNSVVIGKGCTMNDAGRIQIGDNCIIGPNVSMYTIELSTNPEHRRSGHGAQLSKGIIIGSDCWIGGGVIIMPGKDIGRGSIVRAGSVVTKDVPPFTVVAGNPARILHGIATF